MLLVVMPHEQALAKSLANSNRSLVKGIDIDRQSLFIHNIK